MEGFLVPSQFAGPAEIIRFAQAAERLGYDALWGFDFTTPTSLMHAPTSEEIRTEADAFPDSAPSNWYELMITLACVATATRHIKLGTGVIVAPVREPVMLAKQAAHAGSIQQRPLALRPGARRLSAGVRGDPSA